MRPQFFYSLSLVALIVGMTMMMMMLIFQVGWAATKCLTFNLHPLVGGNKAKLGRIGFNCKVVDEQQQHQQKKATREPINWLSLIDCIHFSRQHVQQQPDELISILLIILDHVLELSRQSENKTLTLFSTVYRRMSPLSRSPILELYKSIRRWVAPADFGWYKTEVVCAGCVERRW